MGQDMLYGDNSAANLFPAPAYALLRIPDTYLTQRYDGENRLAADFSALYFPSTRMKILDKHYENGNMDPWGRPSNFAPLIHYLCAISICRLNFGPASVVFISFEYLLFLAVYIPTFKILKIEKNIWVGLLLANCFLFLTPAGLSWFERGQNYLFVGAAYLLLLTGFVKRNNWLILLSAILAFIRWTSLPFMLVCFAVYVFNSKNLNEALKKIMVGTGFGLIMLALSLTLPALLLLFLKQLTGSESLEPHGISLTTLLPTALTKFLPLVLILVGALIAKITKRDFEDSLPFLAGSAILLITYPTYAYEYSLPSLLGFIPLLMYWSKQTGPFLRAYEKKIIQSVFLAFLLLSSFSSLVIQNVLYEYIAAFLILLSLPLYFHWKSARKPEPAQNGSLP